MVSKVPETNLSKETRRRLKVFVSTIQVDVPKYLYLSHYPEFLADDIQDWMSRHGYFPEYLCPGRILRVTKRAPLKKKIRKHFTKELRKLAKKGVKEASFDLESFTELQVHQVWIWFSSQGLSPYFSSPDRIEASW